MDREQWDLFVIVASEPFEITTHVVSEDASEGPVEMLGEHRREWGKALALDTLRSCDMFLKTKRSEAGEVKGATH